MNDPAKTLDLNLRRVDQLIEQSFQQNVAGVPMPSWIEISPVDRCNRKCVICPKSDPAVAPDLSLEMAPQLCARIAYDLSMFHYQGTVMLAGYGEPMLARNIFTFIEMLSKVCRVEITTNGDTLNVDTAKKLVTAGISKIVVSLYDGPEQVGHFTEMFAQAAIDGSRYVLRDRWYGPEQDYGVMLTNRAGTVHAGKQRAADVSCACFYPHYFMMVDWNGDVFLCPQDWNRRVKMGNLAFASVQSVWLAANYRRHRQNLAEGSRALLPCVNCNANGTQHGLRHAAAWTAFYKKGEATQ